MITRRQIDDATELIKRRNQILIDLDVRAFRAFCIGMGAERDRVNAMTDEVAIIAMHKSRVDIVAIPRASRLESVEWLRARGYSLYKNVPLPPPGELPE